MRRNIQWYKLNVNYLTLFPSYHSIRPVSLWLSVSLTQTKENWSHLYNNNFDDFIFCLSLGQELSKFFLQQSSDFISRTLGSSLKAVQHKGATGSIWTQSQLSSKSSSVPGHYSKSFTHPDRAMFMYPSSLSKFGQQSMLSRYWGNVPHRTVTDNSNAVQPFHFIFNASIT